MDTLGMLSQKKYTSNIHRQPQQSQTHTHNNNISNSVINHHHHHGLNGGHFIVEDGRKIDGEEDNIEEVEEQYNHIEREISDDEETEMIANETSNSVSVINHHRDDLQEESFQATEDNHQQQQQQQTVSNELQQIQLLCRDNERLSVIARLSIHLVDRCRNLNKSKKFSEDIGKLSSLIDEFNGENCRSNCSLPNFVTSLQGVLIENKPNNNQQQQQQQNLIYIQYPSHSTSTSAQLQLSLPESESNQPQPQQYLSTNSMIIRNSNNKIKSTSKQQQFNTTTKSSIESDQNHQQSILFKKLTESGQFVKVQNSSSSSLSSKLCDVSTESPQSLPPPPPPPPPQQHLSQHIPLNIVDVVESEQQLFINPNEMMIQQGQSQHQPLRYILTSSSGGAAIEQQPQLQLINSISNLNSGENSSKIIGNSIISNIPIQSKSVKTTTTATTSSPSPNSSDKCRFKCKLCEKLFANSYNLNRHMKSHTGFQNYVCMVQDCRKRFNYNYHLKRHMETHTGARPFVCTWPDCFQRFNRKYNLNRHLWVHTDKNKFQIQQQPQHQVQQQEQNPG